MNAYFQNKYVLITGGSSGIGLALAKRLFARGASLNLLAQNMERLQNARAEVEKFRQATSQTLDIFSADVANLDSVSSAARQITTAGTPDIIFNCAGVARPGYVEELDLDIYHWTMDINYFGTVNVCKVFLPYFLKRGSGHFVNFSSIAGVVGLFGYTAYCGSKFAVRGFSDALRNEIKPKGVRVSIVYPPDTDTPQLAWEDQFKPFETRQISGVSKPLNADDVALAILSQVERGKYAILPGTDAKLMYFAATSLGNLIYPVLDMMVRSALKKKPKT
ncbi:MAG: SDR family oxidoreductase [Anaerolineaceae bacterium]|nr:SDR family oxidoreductase [Anaerolineaceae bacterium]